jgi:hypothetical protein
MRVWAIDPKDMCREHLLGEHLETHMFVGLIRKGVSLKGFIENNLLNPRQLGARHEELVAEMLRRRYKHSSSFGLDCSGLPNHPLDVDKSNEYLKSRCNKCKLK